MKYDKDLKATYSNVPAKAFDKAVKRIRENEDLSVVEMSFSNTEKQNIVIVTIEGYRLCMREFCEATAIFMEEYEVAVTEEII